MSRKFVYVGQENITNENAVSKIKGEPIDDKIEPSKDPASPSRKWKWQGAEYVTDKKAANKVWEKKATRKEATQFAEVRWVIKNSPAPKQKNG